MSWRSWSARVALQLSGQYEPYRLICRWLNVKRPGRCAPRGAQGVDTAYGSSYKGQTIRQQTGSLRGFLSDFRGRTSSCFLEFCQVVPSLNNKKCSQWLHFLLFIISIYQRDILLCLLLCHCGCILSALGGLCCRGFRSLWFLRHQPVLLQG